MDKEEILQLGQIVQFCDGHPLLKNIRNSAMARLVEINAGLEPQKAEPATAQKPIPVYPIPDPEVKQVRR